jgi:hypothetical protein
VDQMHQISPASNKYEMILLLFICFPELCNAFFVAAENDILHRFLLVLELSAHYDVS